MCHVSCVMCHVSCVMGHMSCVTCPVSHVKIFFYIFYRKKKYITIFFFVQIGQSGGASRWRVCYHWGLPRLVSAIFPTLPQCWDTFFALWVLSLFSWQKVFFSGAFVSSEITGPSMPIPKGEWNDKYIEQKRINFFLRNQWPDRWQKCSTISHNFFF